MMMLDVLNDSRKLSENREDNRTEKLHRLRVKLEKTIHMESIQSKDIR